MTRRILQFSLLLWAQSVAVLAQNAAADTCLQQPTADCLLDLAYQVEGDNEAGDSAVRSEAIIQVMRGQLHVDDLYNSTFSGLDSSTRDNIRLNAVIYSLKLQDVDSAVLAANTIGDLGVRADALSRIVLQGRPALAGEAVRAGLSATGRNRERHLLSILRMLVRLGKIDGAVILARDIHDPIVKAQSLAYIASYRSEILPEVLQVASTTEKVSHLEYTHLAVAEALIEGGAFESAAAIAEQPDQTVHNRLVILAKIEEARRVGPKNIDLSSIVSQAIAVEEPVERTRVLTSLMKIDAKQVTADAMEAASKIDDEHARTLAYFKIAAAHLNADDVQQALNIIPLIAADATLKLTLLGWAAETQAEAEIKARSDGEERDPVALAKFLPVHNGPVSSVVASIEITDVCPINVAEVFIERFEWAGGPEFGTNYRAEWRGPCIDGEAAGEGLATAFRPNGERVWYWRVAPGSGFLVQEGTLTWASAVASFELKDCRSSRYFGNGETFATLDLRLDMAGLIHFQEIIFDGVVFLQQSCSDENPVMKDFNVRMTEFGTGEGLHGMGALVRSVEGGYTFSNKVDIGYVRKREIEESNKKIREKIAAEAKAAAAREKGAKRALLLSEWTERVERSLAGDGPIVNIADLMEYDSLRAMQVLSGGRSISLVIQRPSFQDGRFHVTNFQKSFDVDAAVADDGFSWERWVQTTQNPFSGQYQITCIFDADDLTAMKEGASYNVSATLVAANGGMLILDCQE